MMDELYELSIELQRVREERDRQCRINVLLEEENHRLRQLLECNGITVPGKERV